MGVRLLDFRYSLRMLTKNPGHAAAAALAMAMCLLSASAAAADSAGSAETLLAAGHFKRARPLVEARLKSNPNDARALWLLSRIQVALGELSDARLTAEKAVALDGKSADFHQQLADALCEAAHEASMFRAMGLARQCKKELDIALGLDPNHSDSLEYAALFCWRAPEILGGGKTKAHELAQRLERTDRARGWVVDAQLAEWEKDNGRQADDYKKAVETNPMSYRAQIELARFYAASTQPRYDLAEQHARLALGIDLGRAAAYAVLAEIYARRSQWNDLKAILAKAEKNIPDDLSPYYTAADTLLAEGRRLDWAEAWFRKYSSQEPEGESPSRAMAQWRLGLVLEKEGRRQEAARQIDSALRAAPHNREMRDDLKRVSR